LRGLGVQMTKLEPVKDGVVEGSQRRITFAKASAPKFFSTEGDSPDDPRTPKKPKFSSPTVKSNDLEDPIDESITLQNPKAVSARLLYSDDPIDDINSPKKARSTPVHPAAAIVRANAYDQSAKKLNITGTQFILPSQLDPSVLAELPQDIRSKLMAQTKNRSAPKSRPHSPAPQLQSNGPSIPSQFDPEVFAALPDDMKAEVLASYSVRPPTPLTPHKLNAAAPVKKWTPTKRRGRPVGSKNKKEDPYPAFMQSNFIAPKVDSSLAVDLEEALDPEFLAALPEEMRDEVVAEHHRTQIAKQGALMTAVTRKRRRPPEPAQIEPRRLRLPLRDPKPTFTTQELTTLEELRLTLDTWYHEFRQDGPHPDDVAAMERYLRRVIVEEKDMAKVVGVVKWIAWLVDEDDDNDNESSRIWHESVENIKAKVQNAVKERGLGRLDL